MNKFMEFVKQMTLDDSFRYPGLMKRNQAPETKLDPILWAGNSLFHDSLYESRSLNLKNL
jgi:hypothetical protein